MPAVSGSRGRWPPARGSTRARGDSAAVARCGCIRRRMSAPAPPSRSAPSAAPPPPPMTAATPRATTRPRTGALRCFRLVPRLMARANRAPRQRATAHRRYLPESMVAAQLIPEITTGAETGRPGQPSAYEIPDKVDRWPEANPPSARKHLQRRRLLPRGSCPPCTRLDVREPVTATAGRPLDTAPGTVEVVASSPSSVVRRSRG